MQISLFNLYSTRVRYTLKMFSDSANNRRGMKNKISDHSENNWINNKTKIIEYWTLWFTHSYKRRSSKCRIRVYNVRVFLIESYSQCTLMFWNCSRNRPGTCGFSARHPSIRPSSSTVGVRISTETVMFRSTCILCRLSFLFPFVHVMFASGREPADWQTIR